MVTVQQETPDNVEGTQVHALQTELDRCRAVLIRALDALEFDATAAARVDAFELIEDRLEGVSEEDHDRAADLIPMLRRKKPKREF